ncbi:hypothetical protein [Methylomonas koyamae]|uniref:hypothetical protein n=1 Tax=Methylomonas koyamae TaxID=702114 RepID=UPI000B069040|nr:hypothetical protein [Methylomonas koyamae]BBL56612.1 hypothetical protein MKFW12EY_02250 [Methylomonas koyamae]
MNIVKLGFGLVFVALLTAGCGAPDQINARNLQAAHKSMNRIKQHLPPDDRLPFEMAYWLVREQVKNEADFLKAIDGKAPSQLIALGKAAFGSRKSAGDPKYAKLESWEQLLAESGKQRTDDSDAEQQDPRDKKGYPRVDYKMHAM